MEVVDIVEGTGVVVAEEALFDEGLEGNREALLESVLLTGVAPEEVVSLGVFAAGVVEGSVMVVVKVLSIVDVEVERK
jgi:hypothetical protein